MRSCRPSSTPSATRVPVERVFLILVLLGLAACQSPQGEPSITIAYSPRLDAACSLFRHGKIEQKWVDELTTRKSEFDALWNAVGPRLLAATSKVTGKSFPSGSLRARLTLCNVPSQSMLGTSVNMRYALKSFTASPVPMRYKVDTLYHELLHEYLAEHPVKQSALLERHASEPQRVRDHLHLLALQKAVLFDLGEHGAFTDVIAIDRQLPAGHYKRAWEIVNATEGTYLEYVAELRR